MDGTLIGITTEQQRRFMTNVNEEFSTLPQNAEEEQDLKT